MNILVANDDGIEAEGLKRLVEALSKVADIYVCAPHIQRSASGHGITMNKHIIVEPVEFENAQKAVSITGTPADCVKLGIKYFKEKGIIMDRVFSGINHGGNLGIDTLYSGTVSAAIEGSIMGYPSIAVSVNSHEPIGFEYAGELAVKVLKASLGKQGIKTVLNINVPNIPKEEIKGAKCVALGGFQYEEWYEMTELKNGQMECFLKGTIREMENTKEEMDITTIRNNYATITPLQYDLTNHLLVDKIKEWGIEE